jgi:hypothetical protein
VLRLAKPNLDDLLGICRRLPPDERELFAAFGDTFTPEDAAISGFNSIGMNWIIKDAEGAPVAAGGMTLQRKGVYRSWFYAPEDSWAAHGRELTELVRNVVKSALVPDLAHRIETVTLASRSRARAWYEKVGLHLESTLRGYGVDGQDAVMYVALRDAENI